MFKKDPADMGMQDTEEIIYYETNIVCVPILVKNRIKGVLGAADKAGAQTIDPEDVFLLENVAGQIAICVENMELNKNIEETYYNTLVMLARIVEARDPYSAGHLERVSTYVRMVAEKLDIDEETKKILMDGALLHDLGKVGIEDTILKKKEMLTPEEYEIMKQHSVIGENILKPLRSMSKLSSMVRHHHELYDGTGYPDGLKGEEIPLAARILTIVDIYDAITTDRSYKKAMSGGEAIKTIRAYAGNKLDPKLAQIFIGLMTENNKR
ncbi:MAG: HD-GYP domain-containing protein [Candidatus Omnitrophica bacterium]|nr:HD-GYP domain-containing protein [Candidatus Omnitrophota bacterium]